MSFYQNFLKPLSLDIKNFVVDTLFPITCVCCDTEGQFICNACTGSFARAQQLCIVCGKASPGGATHPGCKTPWGADGIVAIYDYHDDNVARAVIQGKYNFLPGVYQQLGSMVAAKLQTDYPYVLTNAAIVPVPLSSARRRWRGFNQSEILCQEIARSANLPLLPFLKRARDTRTQKDLKREERIKNVADCFALAEGIDIHNKSILLVDDVTTTGSTMSEAVKVLKRNGAASVWCLAVARD